jgi:hypothetical protein
MFISPTTKDQVLWANNPAIKEIEACLSGGGGIASLFLSLSSRMRCSVNFTDQKVYHQGKNPSTHWRGGVGPSGRNIYVPYTRAGQILGARSPRHLAFLTVVILGLCMFLLF